MLNVKRFLKRLDRAQKRASRHQIREIYRNMKQLHPNAAKLYKRWAKYIDYRLRQPSCVEWRTLRLDDATDREQPFVFEVSVALLNMLQLHGYSVEDVDHTATIKQMPPHWKIAPIIKLLDNHYETSIHQDPVVEHFKDSLKH